MSTCSTRCTRVGYSEAIGHARCYKKTACPWLPSEVAIPSNNKSFLRFYPTMLLFVSPNDRLIDANSPRKQLRKRWPCHSKRLPGWPRHGFGWRLLADGISLTARSGSKVDSPHPTGRSCWENLDAVQRVHDFHARLKPETERQTRSPTCSIASHASGDRGGHTAQRLTIMTTRDCLSDPLLSR
jgi:hypothetical protein